MALVLWEKAPIVVHFSMGEEHNDKCVDSVAPIGALDNERLAFITVDGRILSLAQLRQEYARIYKTQIFVEVEVTAGYDCVGLRL